MADNEVRGYELLRKGGKWLAAARSWLQWHRRNGSTIIWGSDEVLLPHFNARDVQELAADVAAAAINAERKKQNKALRWALLEAEQQAYVAGAAGLLRQREDFRKYCAMVGLDPDNLRGDTLEHNAKM